NGAITGVVTINNGTTLETGDGTGNGALTLKSLNFGAVAGDLATLNVTASAPLNVTNNNGLFTKGSSGSVTINVGGSIGATGSYTLITYKGTLGGSGFSGFKLGTLPAGVTATLANGSGVITLNVSSV